MKTIQTKNGNIFYIGKCNNAINIISGMTKHPFEDYEKLIKTIKEIAEEMDENNIIVTVDLSLYVDTSYLIHLIYNKKTEDFININTINTLLTEIENIKVIKNT